MERNLRRYLDGKVIKLSGIKTAKVEVSVRENHPVYKKVIKSTKLYLVHYEGDAPEVGSNVRIMSCRPLSKNKHWVISND